MHTQTVQVSATAQRTELADARQLKRWVTLGLGALWTIDGLLQLQPQMFTQTLAVNIVGNALTALPVHLYFASLRLLIHFFIPYVAFWNLCFAFLQLAIGISLLAGSARIRRIALLASIVWGLTLWVFAEGMTGIFAATMSGGVFPGTPSDMNGFPGAALVYVVIAIFLLLPIGLWKLSGRFSVVRDAPAFLFLICAAIQAAPLMWTTFGQASIFAANLDNLPAQFAATMMPIIKFTAAQPILSNGVEISVTILAAFGAWGARSKFWRYDFALAWLAFIWWFGLGLGGTLTGLGTDPNTPPAFALLMLPGIVSCRRRSGESEITRSREDAPFELGRRPPLLQVRAADEEGDCDRAVASPPTCGRAPRLVGTVKCS